MPVVYYCGSGAFTSEGCSKCSTRDEQTVDCELRYFARTRTRLVCVIMHTRELVRWTRFNCTFICPLRLLCHACFVFVAHTPVPCRSSLRTTLATSDPMRLQYRTQVGDIQLCQYTLYTRKLYCIRNMYAVASTQGCQVAGSHVGLLFHT